LTSALGLLFLSSALDLLFQSPFLELLLTASLLDFLLLPFANDFFPLTLLGFCTKAFDLSFGLQLGLFFFAPSRLCLPTALFLAHTDLLHLPSSSLFSLSKKFLALPALKLLTL